MNIKPDACYSIVHSASSIKNRVIDDIIFLISRNFQECANSHTSLKRQLTCNRHLEYYNLCLYLARLSQIDMPCSLIFRNINIVGVNGVAST